MKRNLLREAYLKGYRKALRESSPLKKYRLIQVDDLHMDVPLLSATQARKLKAITMDEDADFFYMELVSEDRWKPEKGGIGIWNNYDLWELTAEGVGALSKLHQILRSVGVNDDVRFATGVGYRNREQFDDAYTNQVYVLAPIDAIK